MLLVIMSSHTNNIKHNYQGSSQLYNSAMQGLSSYANNIMGHTMNQYAAQSSLLTTQVNIIKKLLVNTNYSTNILNLESNSFFVYIKYSLFLIPNYVMF